MTVSLHVEFYEDLDPASFFAETPATPPTAEECAESARRFIEERGMYAFLNDWNLLDFNVYVGGIEVAFDGRARKAQTTGKESA